MSIMPQLKKILIYFWLHWVFITVLGLSLVVANQGYSPVVMHQLLITEELRNEKKIKNNRIQGIGN